MKFFKRKHAKHSALCLSYAACIPCLSALSFTQKLASADGYKKKKNALARFLKGEKLVHTQKNKAYPLSIMECLYMAMIIFVIAALPLILYLKIEPINNDFVKYFFHAGVALDFFSYYKMICLVAAAVMGLVFFLAYTFQSKQKILKTYVYIPMCAYCILAILSTLFSNYNDISLVGFLGRHEGLPVLLSYMAVCFLAINMAGGEQQIKTVFYALIISSALIGTIGLLQLCNVDILQSVFLENSAAAALYKIKNIYPPGTLYATLGHGNYVGSYMAMLFPISLVLLIGLHNNYARPGALALSCLLFVTLLGCRSRAGITGSIVGLAVISVTYRHAIIRKWKSVLAGALLMLVIFFILNSALPGKITAQLKYLVKEIQSAASTKALNTDLKDVQIHGATAVVSFSTQKLLISCADNQLFFKDTEGAYLVLVNEGAAKTFIDTRYKDFTVGFEQLNNTRLIKLVKKEHGWQKPLKFYLAITDSGFKLLNHREAVVDVKTPAKWGFGGMEALGSSRGYIWSRALPLVKNALLLGYGPDTFAMIFPQDDYIGKLISYSTLNMFVDKPHNMFVQVALNSGVLSLLCILLIFSMYILSSMGIYFRYTGSTSCFSFGLAIFAAVTGYLVTGFFNDSVVSVAPVFWILLGIGIRINHILQYGESRTIPEDI